MQKDRARGTSPPVFLIKSFPSLFVGFVLSDFRSSYCSPFVSSCSFSNSIYHCAVTASCPYHSILSCSYFVVFMTDWSGVGNLCMLVGGIVLWSIERKKGKREETNPMAQWCKDDCRIICEDITVMAPWAISQKKQLGKSTVVVSRFYRQIHTIEHNHLEGCI